MTIHHPDYSPQLQQAVAQKLPEPEALLLFKVLSHMQYGCFP